MWHGVVWCSILQQCLDRFVRILGESKRCRGINLSRCILNGHSCESLGATEHLLLVYEGGVSESFAFRAAEWCISSDSIHSSIDTSSTLHLKVIHRGQFSCVSAPSLTLFCICQISAALEQNYPVFSVG